MRSHCVVPVAWRLRAVLRRVRRCAQMQHASTAALQLPCNVLQAHKQIWGPIRTRAACLQIQKILSGVAARNASGEFFYTRFFAIGLFRMLELTEARDPKALEGLVTVRSRSRFLARGVCLAAAHLVYDRFDLHGVVSRWLRRCWIRERRGRQLDTQTRHTGCACRAWG